MIGHLFIYCNHWLLWYYFHRSLWFSSSTSVTNLWTVISLHPTIICFCSSLGRDTNCEMKSPSIVPVIAPVTLLNPCSSFLSNGHVVGFAWRRFCSSSRILKSSAFISAAAMMLPKLEVNKTIAGGGVDPVCTANEPYHLCQWFQMKQSWIPLEFLRWFHSDSWSKLAQDCDQLAYQLWSTLITIWIKKKHQRCKQQ